MKDFFNLSLKAKLLTSFIFLAVFGGLLGFLGTQKTLEANLITEGILERVLPALLALEEMVISSEIMETKAFQAILQDTGEAREKQSEFLESKKEFDVQAAQFLGLSSNDQERRFASIVQEQGDAFYANLLQLIEQSKEPGNEASLVFLEQQAREDKARLEAFVGEALAYEREEFRFQQSRAQAAFEDVVMMAVVFTVAAFVVSILVGILMVRSVIRPLKEIEERAEQIAEGNFDKVITVKSKDEIGRLANAFNKMTIRLMGLYHGLEDKVKERTQELEGAKKDLEGKLAELQKFQELTVGRELRMVELKKELRSIRSTQDRPEEFEGRQASSSADATADRQDKNIEKLKQKFTKVE